MKRVFILGVTGFPRNSAGANYVQYLAKAIKEIEDCCVCILGIGDNIEQHYNRLEGKYRYQNIEYFNQEIKRGKKLFLVGEDIKIYKNANQKYKFNKSDYFIMYTREYFTLRWLKKTFEESHIAVCQVENLQPFQYKMGRFNPKFFWINRCNKLIMNSKIKFLPISNYIAKLYNNTTQKTLVIPIMSDPYEYEYIPQNRKNKKIEIIYPGAKVTDYEDDLNTLIIVLNALEDEYLDQIRIHFTGTSKEKLLKKHNNIDDKVVSKFMFHGFMEYNDLIDLYRTMDYLLLIRKVNDITKANFPSKVPELLTFGVVPICTIVGDYTKEYLIDDINSIQANEDVESISRALIKAVEVEDTIYLKMREEARKLSVEKFAYNNWSNTLNEFLFKE